MIRTWWTQFVSTKGARDAAVLYVGALANTVSLFAANALIARSVDQSLFGAFSLALLVLSAVTEISDVGLTAGMHRFASYYIGHGEQGKLQQLLRVVWRWRLGAVLVFSVGGLLSAGFVADAIFEAPTATPFIRLAFLGVGGVIFSSFVVTYLRAAQRFDIAAISTGAKGLLRLVFVGAAIMIGVDDMLVLLGLYVLVPWVLYLCTLPFLPTHDREAVVLPEEVHAMNKELWRFSKWIVVWSVVVTIGSKVDQAVISRWLGLEEVAMYGVALQLIVGYQYITQSISSVLATKMSAVSKKEELWRLIRASYRWILPLLGFLAVVIYPSQYIIVLFFGSQYAASMVYYVIMAYAMLLVIATTPFSKIITVFNRTELVAGTSAVQLVLSVGLNLWLIPIYGIMGAVIAYVVSIVVVQLLTTIISLRLLSKEEVIAL